MHAFESHLRSILLSKEMDPLQEREQLYRDMIRRNFVRLISLQLSSTKKLCGENSFKELIYDWLHEGGPKTKIYWQIPIEFASWLMQKNSDELQLIAEMAHFESMKISARNAANFDEDIKLASNPYGYCKVRFHPSTRLCIYKHAVYAYDERLNRTITSDDTPYFLLIFREGEDCNWLKLEPQIAQLLAKLDENCTIDDGLSFLRSMYGKIDARFVSSRLVNLQHRGALFVCHN